MVNGRTPVTHKNVVWGSGCLSKEEIWKAHCTNSMKRYCYRNQNIVSFFAYAITLVSKRPSFKDDKRVTRNEHHEEQVWKRVFHFFFTHSYSLSIEFRPLFSCYGSTAIIRCVKHQWTVESHSHLFVRSLANESIFERKISTKTILHLFCNFRGKCTVFFSLPNRIRF